MADKFRFGTRQKDPTAVKKFTLDWAAWLTEHGSTTISTVAWVVPPGITKDSSSENTTTASIVTSAGTLGETYVIECQITTANALVEIGSFKVEMVNK
jgi:hypothetical protein